MRRAYLQGPGNRALGAAIFQEREDLPLLPAELCDDGCLADVFKGKLAWQGITLVTVAYPLFWFLSVVI